MESSCPNEAFIAAYNAGVEEVDNLLEGEFQELEYLESTIRQSYALSSCQTCGEMVVDLSDGWLYCAYDVPGSVIESNELILENFED